MTADDSEWPAVIDRRYSFPKHAATLARRPTPARKRKNQFANKVKDRANAKRRWNTGAVRHRAASPTFGRFSPA